MLNRCPNCDRPMLPSDSRCFHCNTPVVGRSASDDEETPEQAANTQAALRYGLLLLALMVLGIVLLNWMGVQL